MTIKIMLLGLIALSAVAGAADLYRWEDESGRTHVSDVVPAAYRNVATRVDTSPSEISESQQQEALARAAREKALADESARAAREKAAQQKPAPAAAIERATPDQAESECDQLIREYRESQECFAPFRFGWRDGRHRRGGVREDAYLYCKPVPSPYAKCGPPSRAPSDDYYP